jgi:hypothetical protein
MRLPSPLPLQRSSRTDAAAAAATAAAAAAAAALGTGVKEQYYTPEYEGYTLCDNVTECRVLFASVQRLIYPLRRQDMLTPREPAGTAAGHRGVGSADASAMNPWPKNLTEEELAENNVRLYEPVTRGNAMGSYTGFTIPYLLQGKVADGERWFWRFRDFCGGPYRTWYEGDYDNKGLFDGTPHFLTGAGAFLQTVLNGWLGLQYTRPGLSFVPRLPSNTSVLDASGIHLAGASLRVRAVRGAYEEVEEASTGSGHFNEGHAEVTLLQMANSVRSPAPSLWLSFHSLGKPIQILTAQMAVGEVFVLPLGQRANITLTSP